MHPTTTDIDAAARYALARELCTGLDVLDLGAGRGFGARLLVEWGALSVTAVDIESFPDIPGVGRVKADVCQPASLDPLGTFDLVLALGLVEDVERPTALMETVARRLSPGGIAIVTCPAEDDGPAASARAFAQLATGTLGKPSQILFALPANAVLLVDPERAAAPESEAEARLGEIHSTLRFGDLRPHLRDASMIVGIWGSQVPATCVATPVVPEPIQAAVMPEPLPTPPPVEAPAEAPAGFWSRMLGRRAG